MFTIALAALLTTGGPVIDAAPAPPTTIAAVPFQNVSIGGSFWGPRLSALRETTLSAVRHQCDISGRLSNFDKAAAKLKGEPNPGEFEGLLFNDSDVYKMMEGWACLIATETDATRRESMDKELDALIARIGAAQHADGYIDTYYTLKAGIENRFTREEWDHETYCMGHLIEAGAMHFQATGKRNLLTIAIKAADFLRGLYGPGKFTVPPGHQEVELALVKLGEATGDRKYTDLACELVEYRGHPRRALDGSTTPPWGDYAQDHKPPAEQSEAAGHAVRAGYFYSAMADLARLGHGEYRPALDALWEDITQRRIFVTGGIGPSGRNEGFTVPYDIPTESAYQETCASIALCLWAHRMFLLEGDARYMEQFERTVYNAALAGVSLKGDQFFYVNPLASRGGHHRTDWFACACCPPNVLRFFAELGQYAYSLKGNTVYVNLFMESKVTLALGEGTVEIEQKTDYPYGGAIRVNVVNHSDRAITLAVRGDAESAAVVADTDGYRRISVAAHEGGTIDAEISMKPLRVYSDPRVRASVGRVAIVRGPLVYAAESIDNGGAEADLGQFLLPPTAAIDQRRGADGVPVLIAHGFRASAAPASEDRAPLQGLYREGERLVPAEIALRPYFMWANRGESSMRVWLPESPQFLDERPANGARVTASYVYSGDSIDAVADGVGPDPAKGSGDGSIPRLTFWPHRGTEEWVQYDFDRARRVRTASVYWFDDTGVGECRAPRGAWVEYRDGDQWRPIANGAGGAIGVAKNTTNSTAFEEVRTTGLRLRVMLTAGASAGVLEWSFGP